MRIKFIIILLIGILISGCMAKKMAAQNIDFIIEHQVEKKLPLSFSQKKKLSQDVDQFLTENKTLVAQVITHLEKLNFDEQKIDSHYDTLNRYYLELAYSFSDLIGPHLALLDQKQQKEFDSIMNKENAQLIKLKSSLALEKTYKNFKLIFGTLNQDQKIIFSRYQVHLYERHQVSHRRRTELHQSFKEIWGLSTSLEEKKKLLVEAFNKFHNLYPYTEKNKEILKLIFPTLTDKQKETGKKSLQEFIEILNFYLKASF